MNNFTQIINYIMYIIDLIQSWFNGLGKKDDVNNDVDEELNEPK